MNYRDMLLMDYFDESYDDYDDYFNEASMVSILQKALANTEKNVNMTAGSSKNADGKYNLYDNSRNNGSFNGGISRTAANDARRQANEINDILKALNGKDSTAARAAFDKVIANPSKYGIDPASKEMKTFIAAASDDAKKKQLFGKEFGQKFNAIDKKNAERKDRKDLYTTYGGQKAADIPSHIKGNKEAEVAWLKREKILDTARTANRALTTEEQRQLARLNQKIPKKNDVRNSSVTQASAALGAEEASEGKAPDSKKASLMARSKGFLKDHKAGAGAVGAGVGAAAGAAIAGKGIHDLATLKNPAKAKAAWKASGSNLPFDEWLKKEKRKAGIKTAIGGAAAAAGAAGAGYLGYKQAHQESLGELLNEFDDILVEEAYLEGYYGQLGYIAESYDYDDYDDYDDYYDEDYLGLPYFG